jgi:hypothetical protein
MGMIVAVVTVCGQPRPAVGNPGRDSENSSQDDREMVYHAVVGGHVQWTPEGSLSQPSPEDEVDDRAEDGSSVGTDCVRNQAVVDQVVGPVQDQPGGDQTPSRPQARSPRLDERNANKRRRNRTLRHDNRGSARQVGKQDVDECDDDEDRAGERKGVTLASSAPSPMMANVERTLARVPMIDGSSMSKRTVGPPYPYPADRFEVRPRQL